LLSMQQGTGIAQRLTGRVPPPIASLVEELGTAASARGLPIDPLIEKAIEGSAKGVAPDRVASALRLVAMQLDTAAAALRDGGLVSDTLAIAAGEFARSEEHTSELQSRGHLVCRLLLEKKKKKNKTHRKLS